MEWIKLFSFGGVLLNVTPQKYVADEFVFGWLTDDYIVIRRY